MLDKLVKMSKVAKHAIDRNSIAYLTMFVTAHCDLRCKMCFYWENIENASRRNELSLVEIRQIAKGLKGLFQVVLTGGEPFLRKDLPAIVESFIEESGVEVVTIPTNGSLHQRIPGEIKALCAKYPTTLFRLNVSLDGLAERHDAIRRVDGSFEKATQTLMGLKEAKQECPNLAVNTNTVLSKDNAPEIDHILATIEEELGPDRQTLGFPRGSTWVEGAGDVAVEDYERAHRDMTAREAADGGRKFWFKAIAPAVDQTMAHFLVRNYHEQTQALPCLAGQKMVVIDEVGNVYPCEILDYFVEQHPDIEKEWSSSRLGNLRENGYDIQGILASDHAKDVLQFIKDKKCHCTYECAIFVSTVYNPRVYPTILKGVVGNKFNSQPKRKSRRQEN